MDASDMVVDDHDLKPHLDMWRGFLRLIAWSAVAIVVCLIAMWIFLI